MASTLTSLRWYELNLERTGTEFSEITVKYAMGNTHVKPRPRTRNKKQVHWKAAGKCMPILDLNFCGTKTVVIYPTSYVYVKTPREGYFCL